MESASWAISKRIEGGGGTNPTAMASKTIPPISPTVNGWSSVPEVAAKSMNPYNYLVEEAKQFSTEIKRLQAELTAAKQRIVAQDEALAKHEETIKQQTVQLAEAGKIMTVQHDKIKAFEEEKKVMEENKMDLKEMKKMVSKERMERLRMEEKYEKMKGSLRNVSEEFNQLMEELKSNNLEGRSSTTNHKTARSAENNGEGVCSKLDMLAMIVKEKFETWKQSQANLKDRIGNMKKMVSCMDKCLKVHKINSRTTPEGQKMSGQAVMDKAALTRQQAEKPIPSTSAATIAANLQLQQRSKTPTITTPAIPIIKMEVELPEERIPGGCAVPACVSLSTPPLSSHPVPVGINGEVFDEQANISDLKKCDEQEPSSSSSSSSSLIIPDVEQEGESFHAIDTSTQGNVCICGVHFTQRNKLTRHIWRMTEEWKFHCMFCVKQFFEMSELHRHMQMAHKINVSPEEKFVGCVRCGREFETRSEFHQHVKFIHKGTDGKYSSRSLSTPRKRWTPQARQVKHGIDASWAQPGHFCVCGNVYMSEKALKTHLRYKTKERKFPCSLCQQRFISPGGLTQHMKRAHHQGSEGIGSVPSIKVYRCRKCNEAFKTNSELCHHQRSAHKKTKVSVGRFRTNATAFAAASYFHQIIANIPLDKNVVVT